LLHLHTEKFVFSYLATVVNLNVQGLHSD